MRQEDMYMFLKVQDDYMRKNNELIEVLEKTQNISVTLERLKHTLNMQILKASPGKTEELEKALGQIDGLSSGRMENAQKDMQTAAQTATYMQRSSLPYDAPLEHRVGYMEDLTNLSSKRLQIAYDILSMKERVVQNVEKALGEQSLEQEQGQEQEQQQDKEVNIFDKFAKMNDNAQSREVEPVIMER